VSTSEYIANVITVLSMQLMKYGYTGSIPHSTVATLILHQCTFELKAAVTHNLSSLNYNQFAALASKHSFDSYSVHKICCLAKFNKDYDYILVFYIL